jgi:hypothetical protein
MDPLGRTPVGSVFKSLIWFRRCASKTLTSAYYVNLADTHRVRSCPKPRPWRGKQRRRRCAGARVRLSLKYQLEGGAWPRSAEIWIRLRSRRRRAGPARTRARRSLTAAPLVGAGERRGLREVRWSIPNSPECVSPQPVRSPRRQSSFGWDTRHTGGHQPGGLATAKVPTVFVPGSWAFLPPSVAPWGSRRLPPLRGQSAPGLQTPARVLRCSGQDELLGEARGQPSAQLARAARTQMPSFRPATAA